VGKNFIKFAFVGTCEYYSSQF
jgi:hypothetical protein